MGHGAAQRTADRLEARDRLRPFVLPFPLNEDEPDYRSVDWQKLVEERLGSKRETYDQAAAWCQSGAQSTATERRAS